MVDGGSTSGNTDRYLLGQLHHHSLSPLDLWIEYMGLGGNLGELDVEAYLYGLAQVSELDRLLLAEAARELLVDRS